MTASPAMAVTSISTCSASLLVVTASNEGGEVHVFRRGLLVGAFGERILDLHGHNPASQIGPPILVVGVHHLHHPLAS
jgi:hypothetical protein